MAELVGPGEADGWDTAQLAAQQPTTVASQAVARQTETTRYLCAAAHLDEEFAELVVGTLLDEPHRAIAPHYGTDLPAVARHALAARRRRRIRDVALLLVLVAFLGAVAARLVPSSTRDALRGRDALQGESGAEHAARALLDVVWLPGLLTLVAAWAVVAGESWVMRVRVLPTLSRRRFETAGPRSRLSNRLQDRLDAVARSQVGNVVVFSGWNPFVGSGFPVDDWSFAIDVTRARRDPASKEERPPTRFDAHDLHEHVAKALAALGLPGLRVQERLFVNGVDVRYDRLLLPVPDAPPETHVHEDIIRRSLNDVESAARTYLCLEATGWHGQLVVTMFFRAVRLKGSLFVEGASFVLLPLKNRYYRVDAILRAGTLEASLLASRDGLARMIPLLVRSPAEFAAATRSSFVARRSRRALQSLISEGHVVDYGARTSIREVATGLEHNRYFLRLDHEMFVKVARERLLQSISEFLRKRGVDTAEFAVHQTVINRNRTINVSAGAGSQVAVAGGSQRGVMQQQPGSGGATPNAGA